MNTKDTVNREIHRLTEQLLNRQSKDGAWRFCFENTLSTDAYMIIILRTLQFNDEALIRQLHDRILAKQHSNGAWKLYDDDEGNLSVTVEAYYALLFSGYSEVTESPMRKAKHFIRSKGGLQNIQGVLTKVILAATGQYRWPASLMIPLEFLLLPSSSAINFFDFSGFARVHFAPVLLLADQRFSITTDVTPDLSDLMVNRANADPDFSIRAYRGFGALLGEIKTGIQHLVGLPRQLHELAVKKAEQYMLNRIESDGTLYSYATCTFLMIFALLALGYDKRHPIITRAVRGLSSMLCSGNGHLFLQNSPSTIWDTALLSHALQEAGVNPEYPAIQKSTAFLLANQQLKLGDWCVHNPNPVPGGWGFSQSNTMNPDVDDTTAALRAIKRRIALEPAYRNAWNRGLNWILSMQNNDGGWPAFERNTDKELLTWLPIDGAKAAATDPSTADLTGRTLEYLGNEAGLGIKHTFIRRGVDWLTRYQEEDGSWYGRWGICYIYGTWAALTGLQAVGVDGQHTAIQKGAHWLLSIQNPDGGWGESCRSDQLMRYVPLGASTPSQTAWALDALIAVHHKPTPELDKGVQRLITQLYEDDWTTIYPTGAGLPGHFYSHYHSYRYIWPLLTLSHYNKKYGKYS
ncbi:squalene--hopene cyclase [Paenibacillus abyssi]|uniref:Sporulenol synthase n=1 Tax=Paenibacillus abyssi TaxID=1340531 RepID=A0A917CKC9_9BACL|nr:squalene--hopene cyclase [Paenibacillus abyssi]GGF90186.1 sporulenol synthase [Paenibacillus abyssi]